MESGRSLTDASMRHETSAVSPISISQQSLQALTLPKISNQDGGSGAANEKRQQIIPSFPEAESAELRSIDLQQLSLALIIGQHNIADSVIGCAHDNSTLERLGSAPTVLDALRVYSEEHGLSIPLSGLDKLGHQDFCMELANKAPNVIFPIQGQLSDCSILRLAFRSTWERISCEKGCDEIPTYFSSGDNHRPLLSSDRALCPPDSLPNQSAEEDFKPCAFMEDWSAVQKAEPEVAPVTSEPSSPNQEASLSETAWSILRNAYNLDDEHKPLIVQPQMIASALPLVKSSVDLMMGSTWESRAMKSFDDTSTFDLPLQTSMEASIATVNDSDLTLESPFSLSQSAEPESYPIKPRKRKQGPKTQKGLTSCRNDLLVFSPTPSHLIGHYSQRAMENSMALLEEDEEAEAKRSPSQWLRNRVVARMKHFSTNLGFKVVMPYADRTLKQDDDIRTLNFYCHMSKSANRKVKDGECHQADCPFRAVFKLNIREIRRAFVKGKGIGSVRWEHAIKVSKLSWVHNHSMINFSSGKVEPYKCSDSALVQGLAEQLKEHLGRHCDVEVDPLGCLESSDQGQISSVIQGLKSLDLGSKNYAPKLL